MSERGIDISCTAIFSNLVGMDNGPEDLDSSNELMIVLISCGLVGEIKKEYEFLYFMKWVGPSGLLLTGISLSSSGPISVKKLVKY